MGESGYKRVTGPTRCSNGLRGFRVNIKPKLSIQRLRVRVLHFFKVLYKWRKSYEGAVKSLFKKRDSGGDINRNSCNIISIYSNSNNEYRKSGINSEEKRKPHCRLKSLGRTNSFYAEAIADCLEFIKRNSLSVDDLNNEAAPMAVAALR